MANLQSLVVKPGDSPARRRMSASDVLQMRSNSDEAAASAIHSCETRRHAMRLASSSMRCAAAAPAAGRNAVPRRSMVFVGQRTKNSPTPFGTGRKRTRSALFRPEPGTENFALSVITPHDAAAFAKFRRESELYAKQVEKDRMEADTLQASIEAGVAGRGRSAFDAEEKDAKALKREAKLKSRAQRKSKKKLKGGVVGAGSGRADIVKTKKASWKKKELSEEEQAFLSLPEV